MKNDNIRIKRKSPFVLYGALTLIVLIAGVLLIAIPFLTGSVTNGLPFYVLGAIVAAAGLAGYVMILSREIRKPDALVLTNKGFTNYLIGGKNGVYVDWREVSSIKIFGLSKSPSLGLTLENNDTYLQLLSGKELERASENIAMELPVIAIPQRCVKLPIAELKALFSKMVKGAISWENYSTVGKKPEPKPEASNEVPVTVPASEPEKGEAAPSFTRTAEEEFAKAYAPAASEKAFVPTVDLPAVETEPEADVILKLDSEISEEDQRIVMNSAQDTAEKVVGDALDDVILLDLGDD